MRGIKLDLEEVMVEVRFLSTLGCDFFLCVDSWHRVWNTWRQGVSDMSHAQDRGPLVSMKLRRTFLLGLWMSWMKWIDQKRGKRDGDCAGS